MSEVTRADQAERAWLDSINEYRYEAVCIGCLAPLDSGTLGDLCTRCLEAEQ